MKKPVKLRAVSMEEAVEVRRLIASEQESARRKQRARVIANLLDDPGMYATEAGKKAGFHSSAMGILWVRRFNQAGLHGLDDQPRSGRKPEHNADVHNALMGLARQNPRAFGYPYKRWTLKRLQLAIKECYQVHLSGSTIWEWLTAAGLGWKQQEQHILQ